MMEMSKPSARVLRGAQIVRVGRVRQLRDGLWSVSSQSHTGHYLIDRNGEHPSCTCEDFEAHRTATPPHVCKHLAAVLLTNGEIKISDDVQDQPIKRQSYTQDWPAYERATQVERERVVALLRDLCAGVPDAEPTGGRPRLPLRDVIFACALREYVGMSSRRAASDTRAAAAGGLIDGMVSPRTVLRYLDDETLMPILRELLRVSAAPLASVETQFAVDSSGWSTCSHQRWFDVKHGRERSKRQWVSAHIICGTATHIICDAVITPGTAGDAPQMIGLLNGAAERFTMREVSADKAYLSHEIVDHIDALGAKPFIPPKINTLPDGSPVWRRMFALFTYKHETWKAHYHRRSASEAVFSIVKRKHGAALRARKFTAQSNELMCRLIVHNLCRLNAAMHELNVDVEFWGAQGSEDRHVH